MENPFSARLNTRYLAFLLKSNKHTMLMIGTLLFAVFPLLYFLISSSYSLGTNRFDIFINTLYLFTLIGIFTSIILPLTLNSYLHSKKALDVYYALPIKRVNLFLTQLIGYVLIILIPSLIVFIISLIVGVSTSAFTAIPGNQNWSLYFGLFILFFSVMVASLVSLSYFVSNNTGTLLNSFLFTGIIHIFPFVIYITLAIISSTQLSSSFYLGPILMKYISPIISIYMYINTYISDGVRGISLNSAVLSILFMILYWFIITVLVNTVSSLIFQSKQFFKAGTSFTNRWFNAIVTTVSTISLLLMFLSIFVSTSPDISQSIALYAVPIIIVYIFYIVFNAIASRSFKRILITTGRYSIIAVISVGLFISALSTNVFGLSNYTPNASSVSYVVVEVYDFSNLYSTKKKLMFKSKDDIKMISSLQNNLSSTSDTYPWNKDPNNQVDSTVNIKYVLKTGETYDISRSINSNKLKLFEALYKNESFLKSHFPILSKRSSSFLVLADIYNQEVNLTSIPSFDSKTFTDSLKDDLLNLNTELISDNSSTFKFTLNYQNLQDQNYVENSSVIIDSRFSKTLSYLSTLNLDQAFLSSTSSGQYVSSESTQFLYLLKNDHTNMPYYVPQSLQTSYVLQPYGPEANSSSYDYYELTKEDVSQLTPYLSGNTISENGSDILLITDASGYTLNSLLINNTGISILKSIVADRKKVTTTSFFPK